MQLILPFYATILITGMGICVLIFPTRAGKYVLAEKLSTTSMSKETLAGLRICNAILLMLLGTVSLLLILFASRSDALTMMILFLVSYKPLMEFIKHTISKKHKMVKAD